MEDHNSPEAIAARAAQPDPIVMYLIVKESLGMSIGKTAAQCAHASQMLQLRYQELERDNLCGWLEAVDFTTMNIFTKWLDTSFRKVVLRAKDKEWQKIKDACSNHVVVVDAGLTEIAAGSETVIGLWPMHKSQVPKIITKLQTLK
jgi:peptidyl-tRNA hydrolase